MNARGAGKTKEAVEAFLTAMGKIKITANNKKDMEHNDELLTTLVADKLNCSANPFNGKVGYNLEGVTLKDCDDAYLQSANNFVKVEKVSWTIQQMIVDEDDRTAAVFSEDVVRSTSGHKIRTLDVMRLSTRMTAQLLSFPKMFCEARQGTKF